MLIEFDSNFKVGRPAGVAGVGSLELEGKYPVSIYYENTLFFLVLCLLSPRQLLHLREVDKWI